MKNLISSTLFIWLTLSALILFFCSGCAKPGETRTPPLKAVDINGKIYDIRYLYVNESDGFYLLIPRDSTQKLPQITTYPVTTDDQTKNETVIKIN